MHKGCGVPEREIYTVGFYCIQCRSSPRFSSTGLSQAMDSLSLNEATSSRLSTGLSQAMSALSIRDSLPTNSQSRASSRKQTVRRNQPIAQSNSNEAFLLEQLKEICISKVPIIKRIPRSCRNQVARKYSELLNEVISKPDDIKSWCLLLCFPRFCLKSAARGGRNRKTISFSDKCQAYSLQDLANFRPQSSAARKSDKSQDIAKIVQGKIDDFDVKGAVRVISSSDSLAGSTPEVLNEMQAKHPGGSTPRVHELDVEPIVVTSGAVKKKIASFPSGSAGGPDLLRPQVLKDLLSESNGDAGKRLLDSITAFVNVVLAGSVPDSIRPFFFGANLFALTKKTGGYRPIAVGNTLRRLAAKCAGDSVASQRKEAYGDKQLGYNTRRGAEIAVHATQAYIKSSEITDQHVLLKIDFENAFNTLDRQSFLEKTRDKYPSLYRFTSSCYGSPSHLFFGKHVLSSEVGPQQGDPEGPPLFCDGINDGIHTLLSKLNLWYLDDGNCADHFEVVLGDLLRVINFATESGLKIKPSKCELVFLGAPSNNVKLDILRQFTEVCPGIKETPIHDLEMLGSPIGGCARRRLLESKIDEFLRFADNLKRIDAHTALFLLRNCLSIPKVLYYLRTAPCFLEPLLLNKYDNIINEALTTITNVSITDSGRKQAGLPGKLGGLGIPSALAIAPSAFLASSWSTQEAVRSLLGTEIYNFELPSSIESLGSPTHPVTSAFREWSLSTGIEHAPDNPAAQRSWSLPVYTAIHQSVMDSLPANEQARLLSFHGETSAAWLNAFPSSKLGLKLADSHLRISIALRLGSKVCEPHDCVCGAKVTQDGRHGLACKKSAGRFARHTALNDIIKRALASAHVTSILEPTGLCRDDGKRPDGVTIAPWSVGQCMVWDVTVVDALAPSRIASFRQLKAAEEAEHRKEIKYTELVSAGYLFQPIAFEAQGNCGPSTSDFLKKLSNRLKTATLESNPKQFLIQRIGIAIQAANASCVLGTAAPGGQLEEVFLL